MTNSLCLLAIWGVGLAVFLQFLLMMQETPVSVSPERDFSVAHDMKAMGHEYNLVDLQTPAVSGRLLPIFSYLVTRSLLAPWILRFFFRRNGIHNVRVLAAQKCLGLPPTHVPIHRADPETMQQAREWVRSHDDGRGDSNHKSTEKRSGYAILDDDDPSALGDLRNNIVLQRGIGLESPSLSYAAAATGYRSVMDYHHLYQSKKATPSQVMKTLIERQQHHLAHLRIFSDFRPDEIVRQAQASDARWLAGKPLSVWDGVPIAMKDMTPVAGYAVCDGSTRCRNITMDDIPAARFRQAGAILVGMTVMTEGGVTPLGYAAHFDGPFNPHHVGHYPGGSSSGSAVAVAAGLVPVALGFDGGGSIRVPAAMSGVLGLATTANRIPFPKTSTVTNIKSGPLAATLTDVALTHLLLGQPAPGSFHTDAIGLDYLPPPHLSGLVEDGTLIVPPTGSKALKGVRLGIFWDHFQHTDNEVYTRCLEAVRYLEQQGATLVNFTIPHYREIQMSHGLKIMSEFGLEWESRFHNASDKLESNTEVTVAMGRALTADEVLAAEKVRTFAIQYMRQVVFKGLNLDAIVSPMLGDKVPPLPPGYRGYGESNTAKVFKIMRFVPLANFLGLPGLALPVGYENETGLPIGFQLLGDAWQEASLMRVAAVLERFQPRRHPPKENFMDILQEWLPQR